MGRPPKPPLSYSGYEEILEVYKTSNTPMTNILTKRKINYHKFLEDFPEELRETYEKIKEEKDAVRKKETLDHWNSKLKKGLINTHS